MKKRINITIDHQLHQSAVKWAKQQNMTFSALLEGLLEKSMGKSTIYEVSTKGKVEETSNPYNTKQALIGRIKSAPLSMHKQLSDYLSFLEFQSADARMKQSEKRMAPGFLAGQIELSDDFNDTPSIFNDYLK